MEKRGLSQIVVVLLIIVIILLAITVFWIAAVGFIKKQDIEQVETFINCIQEVEIEILDACFNNNLLEITVKNKRGNLLGDFFLVRIVYSDGTIETVPTPYNTHVEPYSTNKIFAAIAKQVSEIKVIPRLEKFSYLCEQSSKEYKNLKQCEDI